MSEPINPRSRRPGEGAEFWRSFRMFEDLDTHVLTELAATSTRREWPAGTTLFQRGDPGDYMIAIASGRIRLSLGSAIGRELVLRHAEPGDLLGEMALFDAEPRSADAVAALPTLGLVMHRAAFFALAARFPVVMQSVARYLCGKLRDTTDQLEGIALYDLEARLARFFLFTLRQIHGEELPDRPSLRLEVNQSELAAMLGASRPKVNRALQSLKDSGAIERKGDVFVCETDALRLRAEPDSE